MGQPIQLLTEAGKRSVQETLLQYGIEPKIARDAAQVELRYPALRRTGPGLKSFYFVGQAGMISSLENLLLGGDAASSTSPSNQWLKPPRELVQDSARTGLALCVNAAGEWSLRDGGYFAISHVWEEGIQADSGNRGIPLSHVQQIIKRIPLVAATTAGGDRVEAQWIWLDGLAIPGSSRALSLQEEELKIAIINNLARIYKRAASVIIFDALVMQLQSTDPLAVAACLVCGKWLTRVWTYQEIYLAKKALILTETGFVDFLDMLRRLRAVSGNEGHLPEMFGTHASNLDVAGPAERSPGKYEELYLTLVRLWGADGKKPSLAQIVLSCHNRKTGNDIDYARAFFPVLGLTWRSSLGREEGMELIYNSQRWYAKRLLLMHGSPRSSFFPGWAPSYLTGLSGRPLGPEQPLGDIDWQPRGLRRTWHTYKVRAQHPTGKKDGLLLALEGDTSGSGSGILCGCTTSDNERAESVSGFLDAVARRSAYMLANEELIFPSRHGLAYAVMLVERNREVGDMDEAWVYLTAEVTAMQCSAPRRETSWLILHESPIGTHDRSGKTFSKLARLLSDEAALHGGQTPLHVAAEAGDEEALRGLLAGGQHHITAQDERGWTPLHAAAYQGHASSVRLLLEHGAPIDALDSSDRSPLMIAADRGNTDAARELLRNGADVNLSGRHASSPLNQALIAAHVETVRALLDAGARPQGRDAFGFDPLLLACDKDVRLADLLFSAGAEPLADLVGGSTALHFAARAGCSGFPDTQLI